MTILIRVSERLHFCYLLFAIYYFNMSAYLALPFIFLKFWFVEAPLRIMHHFGDINSGFFEIFSLPLLIKTFFKPLKNEYRKGLVGFSIGMGIFVKSILIFFDLFLFGALITLEGIFLIAFILLPFLSVLIFFK